MKRRKYLATIGTASLATIAGCSDVLGGDESEARIEELESQLEARNETVSELEQERNNLEEELNQVEQDNEDFRQDVNELEDEIESLEEENENSEEEVANLKQQRETLIINRMETLYESAQKLYNVAEEEYSMGVTETENDQYTQALNRFRSAYGRYDGAAELTFLVNELANDEDYSNAASFSSESNTYVSAMRNTCDSYSTAAGNFALGYTEQGNADLAEGDQSLSEADQYTFYSLREFENSIESSQ